MASAAASSSYGNSSGASSSYVSTSASSSSGPKFMEYRSRVMLGDLPQDFLRIQLASPYTLNLAGYNAPAAYSASMLQQQLHQNSNFLGYFTLTIAEARLVKNSSLLGLMKMDPYVRFRIGHVTYETPTASGGGKNPQWRASYRINLFKGMDRIHFEVYDQRNFTEDSFIGECEIMIPREVMEGETRQHWYTLLGRPPNVNENQGDILIIMSVMPRNESIATDLEDQSLNDASARRTSQPAADSQATASRTATNTSNSSPTSSSSSSPLPPTNLTPEQHHQSVTEHVPSAVPKPPPPPYTADDVQTIAEMFPTVDRRTITGLLDQHQGNKDLVVNQLLQNSA